MGAFGVVSRPAANSSSIERFFFIAPYGSFRKLGSAAQLFAANRSTLEVQGHTDDHLVKVGAVLFIVTALTD
jgi:hypothetical protein